MTTEMRPFIAKAALGQPLDAATARAAFEIIMSGEATPAQIGGFLMALRVRGETPEEIAAAARVMRDKAVTIDAPEGAIDCCGTGGDNSGSFNVSTAVSFVLAGAGVPVAKHGNRAASSLTGAANVLTELGVNVEAPPEVMREALWETQIGFLFAPLYHSAMRHVGPARQELGTRTIFNLLGPLANPAGVKRQLLGVFAEAWIEPVAQALQQLGSETAWVVHGSDGLDEMTTTGPTAVAELRGGQIRRLTVTPEDAGLRRAVPEDLKGGDPATNAAALRAVLGGAHGAYRDIVLLNAAACFIVADRVATLTDGAALAARTIDDGSAAHVLERLARITSQGTARDAS
jgi:anthranilate phosphoribosyltransferase